VLRKTNKEKREFRSFLGESKEKVVGLESLLSESREKVVELESLLSCDKSELHVLRPLQL
jgi:hypothetical protein